MSHAVIAILVVLIVIATLMPLSRHTKWWVRDLDFPRLQIAVVALAVLVAEAVLLDLGERDSPLLMIITAACLIYQAWWIFPYTRPYPNEVKMAVGTAPGDRIRILTANVLTPNRNADKLIALIREHKPHVFVTLETDKWWQERLDVLDADYPYSMKCPLDNLYGMHVYSNLPLEDGKTSSWSKTISRRCTRWWCCPRSARCASTSCIRHRPARPNTTSRPSAMPNYWWWRKAWPAWTRR